MALPERNARNLEILERRRNRESFASIGKFFGLSVVRVRQIFEREDARAKRTAELEEAVTLPQQPNPLQLPPRLRDLLAQLCGKPDFTPANVMALDYTPAMFFLRLPLNRKDWRDLSAWVAAGGLSLERPVQKMRRPESANDQRKTTQPLLHEKKRLSGGQSQLLSVLVRDDGAN